MVVFQYGIGEAEGTIGEGPPLVGQSDAAQMEGETPVSDPSPYSFPYA